MTIMSTICWGSFANTFKGTKNYRFELYYWDYGLGIFLISLVLAFTMGSINGGIFSFLPNLHQAENSCLLYAAFGGFVFNIANVLLIAAIEMVGLAIAFPLAIGIALVEGTALSYIIHPAGNATLLFSGVAMALVAVIFIGFAYAARGVSGAVPTRKGIIVCLVSGVLMGSWAPLLEKALTGTGISAGLAVPVGALSPYTAAVFMTLGAFVCCFIFNPILMWKPLIGQPVSMAGYFGAPARYHVLGPAGRCDLGHWGRCSTSSPAARLGCPFRMLSGRLRRWSRRFGAFSFGKNSPARTRAPRVFSARWLRLMFLRLS